VGLTRKMRIASSIFNSFHGFKGKTYAIAVIMNEARKSIVASTGIELNLPVRFRGKRFDALSEPVGLVNLWALDHRLEPLNAVVKDEPARINVLLPSLDPKIIFGGYIAVLNFILRLEERGYRVRIIICEEVALNEAQVRVSCESSRLANAVLQKAELLVAHDRREEVAVSAEDVFVGYSWLTMRMASMAAQRTNDKLPIFFIQEFEAIFHHYDSFHALCIATYRLPHFALYNSRLLTRFFEREELSVFDAQNQAFEKEHKYEYFTHAISDIRTPSLEKIINREKKKLLYYARPEAHAGRNIFEIGILALREAIVNGVFDDTWEFYGIGSLALHDELELPNDAVMKILPRVTLEEYCEMMSDFDVGIALMYAPHPSVPPFEMAAAGMLTVTTTFGSRTPEDVESISKNLIAVNPDPNSVADGIRKAVERVEDYQQRIDNAKFDCPRDWGESFSDELMERLVDVLPSDKPN